MTTSRSWSSHSNSFALAEAIAILQRTPVVIDTLLRGLPDTWLTANEGVGTWSPFDVVGHLIHGERTNWMPRARMILELGESRTFDRIDRTAQFSESPGKTLADLLDELAAERRRNLSQLAAMQLTDADLDRRGHAPAAAGDMGGARSRSHHADRSCPRAPIFGRSRSVAGVPARH